MLDLMYFPYFINILKYFSIKSGVINQKYLYNSCENIYNSWLTSVSFNVRTPYCMTIKYDSKL